MSQDWLLKATLDHRYLLAELVDGQRLSAASADLDEEACNYYVKSKSIVVLTGQHFRGHFTSSIGGHGLHGGSLWDGAWPRVARLPVLSAGPRQQETGGRHVECVHGLEEIQSAHDVDLSG